MSSSFAHGNRTALAIIVVFIFVATSLGIWYSLQPPGPKNDELLERTFSGIAVITSYTQSVETEIDLSDRKLLVSGEYYLNGPDNRFESVATTTLRISVGTKDEEHSFTLRNISIGEDVYSKIDTRSPVLAQTIPHSPEWRHFSKNQIPEAFADIAISGPILDNLLLFRDGAFLELIQSYGEETWGNERLVRYAFTISREAPEAGGTLATLLGRIGDGRVDMWIEPESASLRHAVFSGPSYHSTTTFSFMNIPRTINAPIP